MPPMRLCRSTALVMPAESTARKPRRKLRCALRLTHNHSAKRILSNGGLLVAVFYFRPEHRPRITPKGANSEEPLRSLTEPAEGPSLRFFTGACLEFSSPALDLLPASATTPPP